jgi:hypothetical protein
LTWTFKNPRFSRHSWRVGVTELLTKYLGNGNGGFAAPVTPFTTGGSPGDPAVGDFNEDGNQDVAIPTNDNHNIYLYYGLGNGTFTPGPLLPFGAANTSGKIIAQDLNGDGHLDLVLPVTNANQVKVYFGSGTGSFSAPLALSVPDPIAVVAGDFNGDGKMDLAVTSQNQGEVYVFLGTGGGSFSMPLIFPSGRLCTSLTFRPVWHRVGHAGRPTRHAKTDLLCKAPLDHNLDPWMRRISLATVIWTSWLVHIQETS